MSEIKNSGIKNIDFINYSDQSTSYTHRKNFLNAGIVILNSNQIILDSVKVNNYIGEGVSFQRGSNFYFSNLECKNNFSHGIYLGTSAKEILISKSKLCRNGGDGIYFCYKVSNSLIENCLIEENLENGIGGFGGAGGRRNVISRNVISKNLKSAIHLYETGNEINNNVFCNNQILRSNSEFGNVISKNAYKFTSKN